MKSLRKAGYCHSELTILFLVLSAITGCAGTAVVRVKPAANVILMIGDGMGPEQVKAAECFKGKPLFFQSWRCKASVDTASANSNITDSAAAATAMATGIRVNNGVISLAIPGGSNELFTALEYFKEKGKLTALVTSDSITGATPAAFGSHESSRGGQAGIAGDYLSQTRPNVLFGGGGLNITAALAAGYLVVTNRDGLIHLNAGITTNVAGIFGKGSLPYEYDGAGSFPHLSEMTRRALDILEKGSSGFFLLVEGGNIDHACHANDLTRMIPDVLQFEDTAAVVMTWAKKRSDTLIIITADHETGGLKVVKNNGSGKNPTVEWTNKKKGHTGVKVPLWAWGVNSDSTTPEMSNTNIFQIMVQP